MRVLSLDEKICICEGRRVRRMLWGRWKTGIAEEDAVGSLELLGSALFNREDACQPYAIGHPI